MKYTGGGAGAWNSEEREWERSHVVLGTWTSHHHTPRPRRVCSLQPRSGQRSVDVHITILSDERIRLEGGDGPLTITAGEASFSPFHMVASGLGACTWIVLASWAHHAKLDASLLAVDVAWSFFPDAHRVARWAVTVRWPTLPESRRRAALRAAELCGVHETLAHPGAIEVTVAE